MRDVSRKPAAKARAAKKTAARKPAAKKTAAKQVAAKKPAARKPPQSMPYEQGKWAEVFAPRAPGEVRQGMTEAPLTHHPDSGVPVRRVLSGGLATFTTAGAATGAPGGTPMPMGGCGSGCGCAM